MKRNLLKRDSRARPSSNEIDFWFRPKVVLAAHSGLRYDFPLLAHELLRHALSNPNQGSDCMVLGGRCCAGFAILNQPSVPQSKVNF